jgi:hypothetical protein
MKTITLSVMLALALAAEIKLGKPLMEGRPMSVDAVASAPDQYAGKTIQVKGKVSEVCQMAGCWMQLVDPSTQKALRIKVRDGQIVFPRDAVGKTAIAEGKLTKIELSREQLIAARRHEAEEQGKTFDPASVKSGQVVYQIAGTGAVILE